MKKEDNIPINLDSEETGLLKLISLFQDEFSIDWLVELTGLKSSPHPGFNGRFCKQRDIEENKIRILYFFKS